MGGIRGSRNEIAEKEDDGDERTEHSSQSRPCAQPYVELTRTRTHLHAIRVASYAVSKKRGYIVVIRMVCIRTIPVL